MHNAIPQCFHVTVKNFMGNKRNHLWFCIVNNVMSPYDYCEIMSGFSVLVSHEQI